MSDDEDQLAYISPHSSPSESRASSLTSDAMPLDDQPIVPLSPRSTLNILTGLPDLDPQAKSLLAGLARGMANRAGNHDAERKHLLGANAVLQHRFDDISRSLLAYEGMGKQDGPPLGYEANDRHISRPSQSPTDSPSLSNGSTATPDGRVNVLAGLPEEDGQHPYIMELFAPPNPHPGTPTDPLPLWFHKILTGNNVAYHTLHSEVSRLPSWEHIAEVERFRLLDDRRREIRDELAVLGSELVLVEDRLTSCCHRLEAANTHSLISHLEGRELYHRAGLGRATCTNTPQLAHRGRRARIREPGVSL
jgi:hypothetical protein